MLPVCITVGSHLCHAVGIAWGAKIKGEKIAVLSSSGDGSTSQGDFSESLNFAGVFKLPVVFAIQNITGLYLFHSINKRRRKQLLKRLVLTVSREPEWTAMMYSLFTPQ